MFIIRRRGLIYKRMEQGRVLAYRITNVTLNNSRAFRGGKSAIIFLADYLSITKPMQH
jgi:hypothetical protein